MQATTTRKAKGIGMRYRCIRAITEEICRPLQVEDYVVQPREWVSPPKWHLGHTAWFFETFLLSRFLPGYAPFDAHYGFLFNSYYQALGARAEKARRGTYSRPTVEEVYRYRHLVDMAMEDLLAGESGRSPDVESLVELGLHHEQQHQELLLADIKAILHANPSRPAYAPVGTPIGQGPESVPVSVEDWVKVAAKGQVEGGWIDVAGGVKEVGWAGGEFAYDNERPRHKVYLADFRIRDRLVTNRQYLDFVEEGGYARPGLWLSNGWTTVQQEGWQAPLYWEWSGADRERSGTWLEFTERGMASLDLDSPVRHVSYYEADAFARWSGARLPTEEEWEVSAGLLRDRGEVWEWTGSAYLPYPGFRPFAGEVAEYNGKFMVDQMVLRGDSRATPQGHSRVTYRNFYPASSRWQFGGIRLAEGP